MTLSLSVSSSIQNHHLSKPVAQIHPNSSTSSTLKHTTTHFHPHRSPNSSSKLSHHRSPQTPCALPRPRHTTPCVSLQSTRGASILQHRGSVIPVETLLHAYTRTHTRCPTHAMLQRSGTDDARCAAHVNERYSTGGREEARTRAAGATPAATRDDVAGMGAQWRWSADLPARD